MPGRPSRKTSRTHVLPRGSGVEVSSGTSYVLNERNEVIALSTLVTVEKPAKTIGTVETVVTKPNS